MAPGLIGGRLGHRLRGAGALPTANPTGRGGPVQAPVPPGYNGPAAPRRRALPARTPPGRSPMRPVDFSECRAVILCGVLVALREREGAVRGLKRTGRGELPITGVALDLAPWHGGVGL